MQLSPSLVGSSAARTLDASRLNDVANHSEVRPRLGGEGQLDLSGVVSDLSNYAFEVDGGGFICIKRADGLYEVHSLFLPRCRGAKPVDLMRDAMRYMFTQTDCVELITRIPDDNPAAATLAQIGGFSFRYRREESWPSGASMIGAAYHGLTVEAWALGSEECLAAGHVFHDALERAKAASGSALPVHPEDPAHDAVVGAAAMMVFAGNTRKGVILYNRWAGTAGYTPAAMISLNPAVLDIGDAIVEADSGEMRVLLCR